MTIRDRARIDWDDVDQIIALRNSCNARLKELGKLTPNQRKKENVRVEIEDQIFSIEAILKTDVSELYKEEMFDISRRYYVYVCCDKTSWKKVL